MFPDRQKTMNLKKENDMKKIIPVMAAVILTVVIALKVTVPDRQDMDNEIEIWAEELIDMVAADITVGKPPLVAAQVSQAIQNAKPQMINFGVTGIRGSTVFTDNFLYSTLYEKNKDGGKDVLFIGILGRVYRTEGFDRMNEKLKDQFGSAMKGR